MKVAERTGHLQVVHEGTGEARFVAIACVLIGRLLAALGSSKDHWLLIAIGLVFLAAGP